MVKQFIRENDTTSEESKKTEEFDEHVVYMTDSEDEDTESEPEPPMVSLRAERVVLPTIDLSKQLMAKKRQFASASRGPLNDRAKLKMSLLNRVKEVARENYCKESKIKSQHLESRLEISKRCRLSFRTMNCICINRECRQLIEMMKAEEERREALEEKVLQERRIELNEKFRQHVSAYMSSVLDHK